MPKKTFYNLKDSKKQAIKESALNEFSTYGYYNTKISRIAANSHISVGSFYQYFDDINDLFMYCVSGTVELKLKYIQDALESCDSSAFEEILQAIYSGGIKFAMENPQCFKLGRIFVSISNTAVFEKLLKYYSESEDYGWFYEIFDRAVQNREIRSDIPFDLFLSLFSKINLSIIEYLGILDDEKKQNKESFDQMARFAVEILLNGVKL